MRKDLKCSVAKLLQALLVMPLLLLLTACATERHASLKLSEGESLSSERFHLGSHSFPISTQSDEAQLAFNRGLTLAYAFSHAASEQEFRRAAMLDPANPMPWWGVALVNGPHINYPAVPPEKAKVAWDALTRAQQLKANGSQIEKDLIAALSARYAEKQPEDRSSLDKAYAVEMKKVWGRYPSNADIATLYAEALMDLHPWDLWKADGAPQPWTPEIVSVLETAMKLNPSHPGAHHLYIHTVEASTTPERGVPSADTLMTLVPGASHLVHMPAHIYLRVGRLDDAALANENAILADDEFRKAHPRPGFYALYMAHNNHFLSFVRMMQGNYDKALAAARGMIDGVPPNFLEEYGPIADGYMVITHEVMMRFGKWNELLAEPRPPQGLPIAEAMWRFSRAVALTALDRHAEAKKERVLFLQAVKRVPADATFGNNKGSDLLRVARLVLDGEMAARQNRFDDAIKSLTTAARLEDRLRYDEPPDWILPVRHTLGITLLRAGKANEAEKAYREDLSKFPNNGWSLYGLSRALDLQGRSDEAQTYRAQFQQAWDESDTQIASSCMCQPGV
ncbi:MAG: tetratricopeptide repeat protein [Deltaproteobacteria bacterium]|nr:tetratricopeptide repeat protein [Deltaproteobacteria bacterium]